MCNNFGSYCDEFGHPKDPEKKFMGIAGLLTWSDKWENLQRRWKEVCKDEKIPEPFHMTDFVHYSERFRSERWADETERLRVLNLLLHIIKEAEAMPIGASVVLGDYNSLSDAQKRKLGNSPYYVAFQEVTLNIGFAVWLLAVTEAPNPANAKVSMVYAKLKGFTGPAEGLWNEIKAANLFGYWMSSYTPGDPADYAPLQAADIWAYSLGHMGEHHPPKKTEAEIAFEFFTNLALKSSYVGHKFFTLFDKTELFNRLGESYDAA